MPKMRLRNLLLPAILIALLLQPLRSVWAAVVLNYFRATSQVNGILLEWQTFSETQSSGFYIQRSTKQDTGYIRIIIYFHSDSETGEGVYYSYQDYQVNPGTIYYYKLEALDMDGTSAFYGPVSAGYLLGTSTPTSAATSTPTLSGPVRTSTPTSVTTLFLTRTPTPTRTATSSSLFIPTITLTQTITGTVSGKPTVTPTLEPLPTFEYLFPASTATSVPSKTPSPTIISAQQKLTSTAAPTPLSPRHIVLLGIILLLWAFLSVFLVLLLRILFQNALQVEEG